MGASVKFKLDENLPPEAGKILRDAGHDALSVLDQHLGGKFDARIASVCMAESRVLITLDTDFGNILAYPPEDYPGIIVIRSADQAKVTVLEFMRRIRTALASESPHQRLWIVEDARIRVRGPESSA